MRFSFGFARNPRLLSYHGPTLSVNVGFDKTWRASSDAPPNARGFELEALVDTGAQDNCIDRLVAAQLNLPVVDRERVCGVHGEREVDVYVAQVYVPALKFTEYGKFAGVELKESGHRQHLLLGRTFLSHFTLVYDGKTGEVSLAS
jgi:predicted aspartyl protease